MERNFFILRTSPNGTYSAKFHTVQISFDRWQFSPLCGILVLKSQADRLLCKDGGNEGNKIGNQNITNNHMEYQIQTRE